MKMSKHRKIITAVIALNLVIVLPMIIIAYLIYSEALKNGAVGMDSFKYFHVTAMGYIAVSIGLFIIAVALPCMLDAGKGVKTCRRVTIDEFVIPIYDKVNCYIAKRTKERNAVDFIIIVVNMFIFAMMFTSISAGYFDIARILIIVFILTALILSVVVSVPYLKFSKKYENVRIVKAPRGSKIYAQDEVDSEINKTDYKYKR